MTKPSTTVQEFEFRKMGGGRGNAAALRKRSEQPPNVKAGINFPVGKTATLFKDHVSCSLTDHAAVFLAASLEYLAAEFTDVTGTAAMEDNTDIIRSRHVYSAVRDDKELTELLYKFEIEIGSNEEEVKDEDDDDDEYDYDSDEEEDIDEIPSDMVEECDDADTDEDVNDNSVVVVDDQECVSVVVGQMSIAPNHMKLYRELIDKFGEIVSPNLPDYKIPPTCVALSGLLNLVETMVDITPEEISQEMVSDWERRVSFYGGIELKVSWLEDRVCRYSDWLVRRSGSNVNNLMVRVTAKQEELKEKRKEVSALETELQELYTELETAQISLSQFGFSFFDE